MFWCEDGHLIATSLLYDIAIFNYSTVARQWFAFNETGGNGYICLLSSDGHTDVLHGVEIVNMSNDILHSMQFIVF